jgi:hypothetical protein
LTIESWQNCEKAEKNNGNFERRSEKVLAIIFSEIAFKVFYQNLVAFCFDYTLRII